MMVHRTGGDRGNIQIDIRLKGYGRFRCSAETQRVGTAKRRISLAKLLAEIGQFDVLRGLDERSIAWATVELAQRQQRLRDDSLGSDLKLSRNLAAAVTDTLPRMGKEASTRKRYELALTVHLRALGVLTDATKVSELKRDDWTERLAAWDVAVPTKNGVRRAVSRFLTRYLGDVYHPFRRAVLHEDRWPKLKEPKGRVRGFAPEHFWPLMAQVPDFCVPSYVLLATTGMRVGEYLNDTALRLDEINRQLIVHGKTGPKVYGFAAAVWPYVRAAVPCRVANLKGKPPTKIQNDPRYKKLYTRLEQAGTALGIDATVHDLRRLFVRVGVTALGETATQTAVGHETSSTTREYARWHTQQQVADAVAAALGLVGDVSGKKPGNSKQNRAARGGKR